MRPSDQRDRPQSAARRSPAGSHVLVIPPAWLWRAAEVVTEQLTAEQTLALKIASGEHLALLLTTAFLTAAPVSIDVAGGHDVVFHLAHRGARAIPAAQLGMGEHPYAAFEVKSLPGRFREFNAAIDRAERAGRPPRQTVYGAKVRSVNDILAHEGRDMFTAARTQLDRKTLVGHSKNIFLIAHSLEHPAVEPLTEIVVAHLLEPLNDLHDIATVWLLWAPSHLVVWSTTTQTWTNLMFTAADTPDDPNLHLDPSLELLQHIEDEFLTRIGRTDGSPYLFSFSVAGRKPPPGQ
jgi:hypothetical protein